MKMKYYKSICFMQRLLQDPSVKNVAVSAEDKQTLDFHELS
jgi:hypothetical protein